MKKRIAGLLALVAVLGLLAGCSKGGSANSLKYIQDKGTIVMGLDDSFPPMGFRDDAGNLVGYDIDVAQEMAKRMNLELKLQPIDWKAKEMELDAKNVDVLWNAYTITDERKEQVLFSNPYMDNFQVVVVLQDSDIQKLTDLSGKKVAVQDGSSAQEALQKDEAVYNSIGQQLDFKENVSALLDLENGQVDAVAVDSVVADYYLAQKPGVYRILEETLAPEEYGVGFRKTDVEFRDACQKVLDEMKADGTMARISNEWFGRDVSK